MSFPKRRRFSREQVKWCQPLLVIYYARKGSSSYSYAGQLLILLYPLLSEATKIAPNTLSAA